MKQAKKETARSWNSERPVQGLAPENNCMTMLARSFKVVKGPILEMPEETPEYWNAKVAWMARQKELHDWWSAETDEPETQEWRDNLTIEEAELVSAWDECFEEGYVALCKRVAEQG